MDSTNFITNQIERLEQIGEILPGSGAEILKEFRPTGDIDADVTELHDQIYGRVARNAAGDDELPMKALPRSPYLRSDAPSLNMPPVNAALTRLGVLRLPKDEAEVAKRFVSLTSQGDPGPIAGALIRRLYDDRSNHGLLKEPPAPPYNERKARQVLEDMRHYLGGHVDLDDLAHKWGDIGTISREAAIQRVTERLKDPKVAADLCRHGEVPDFDPHDEVFAAKRGGELADSLRASGMYDV